MRSSPGSPQPPDDFEAGNAHRDVLWAALPSPCRAYIARQRATVAALRLENRKLRKRASDDSSSLQDSLADSVLDAQLHELRCRADDAEELAAIVEAAWASRFLDAAEFKVDLLQRAHRYMLKRLRCSWNSRRFVAGEGRANVSASPLTALLGCSAAQAGCCMCCAHAATLVQFSIPTLFPLKQRRRHPSTAWTAACWSAS